MNSIAPLKRINATSLFLALIFTLSQPLCFAATHQAKKENPMTLSHLKNACYQIPDLACGYTNVRLNEGQGESNGIKVEFGRAVFGKLEGKNSNDAVVHLAYFSESLGWLQELVFVRADHNRLMQIAEYGLDDREQLKDIVISNGQVVVQSIMEAGSDHANKAIDKRTTISLAQSAGGCALEACQWERLPGSASYKRCVDLTPYLSQIEESIERSWAPTNRDRGEHVVVSFKIKQTGDIEGVHVSSSSETTTADSAAVKAINNAAPFPPLPAGTGKALDVCFEFQTGVTIHSGRTVSN